jgi:hypothetical protein
MMTHEQHAVSTEEFVDFLTDALIDSTDADWTCTDGAWAIVRQLAKEGRLTRLLNAFESTEEFRVGPSIYEDMAATIEVKDENGVYGWRSVATCWSYSDANFMAAKLNSRDSDATATAALCEDIAVPKDLQARANGIAK